MGGFSTRGKGKKKVKKQPKKNFTVKRKVENSLTKAASAHKKMIEKRAEKLIPKAIGSITSYNVKADSKNYEETLGQLLLNMGDGLTTSAVADSAPILNIEEMQKQLLALMESDNAKRLKAFVSQGTQELVIEPVEGVVTLTEAFSAYLLGDYPEFPQMLIESVHRAIEEEKYTVTHLDEVVEDKINETTDTISNGTPEEQGAMAASATIFVAGGVFKKFGGVLKKVSNTLDVDMRGGGSGNLGRHGDNDSENINNDNPDAPIVQEENRQQNEGGSNKSIFQRGLEVYKNFNIDDAYVKPKHLSTTGGNGQKFLGSSKIEAEEILKDAMRTGSIKSIVDNGLTRKGVQSFEITINAGKPVGTRGETFIRIILAEDGGMLSAFPVN